MGSYTHELSTKCVRPSWPSTARAEAITTSMLTLIDKHATGMTAKGIKAANLKPLSIPIPPLAEQHRIVSKVDELMAFCDRLEASLIDTAATRRRLLDALLAEALAPVDAREMEAAQ